MATNFPIHNLRQSIDAQWEQISKSETITVPNDGVYTVKLLEVPDNGSISTDIVITGLTKSISYPPSTGQYFVNYNTGYIVFNVNESGNSYDITYWAKGSLIEADDINYLNEKYNIDTVSPSGYYGQQHYDLNTGIAYCYDIRDKWLSVQRQTIVFGRIGNSMDQYLDFFGSGVPSNNSGLRMARNATIVSLAGQLDVSGSCDMYIRRNDTETNIATLNITSALGDQLTNIDTDITAGDYLQSWISSIVNVEYPMLVVEIAWRL